MKRQRALRKAVTDKRAYSVSELSRLYPVSTGFLRGEIRRGVLRARRFGRRVLVLREDWDAYVATRDEQCAC
jgi:excisionase family DNA binding protein